MNRIYRFSLAGFFLAAPAFAADLLTPSPRVEVRKGVSYLQRGDQQLAADLYLPASPGRHPGVLMVHGGAWRSGNRWQVWRHARVVAEAGYVVMAIDYRLAPAHRFPAPWEDCRAAVRWMRKHADELHIDPERIAGYGYSAGGHLVSLLGVSDDPPGLEPAPPGEESISTRLQAVVAGGAPCDFEWLDERNATLAYFFGGSRAEQPELYHRGSPVNFVTQDDPPVFLFHGESDWVVPLVSARVFYRRLQHAGVRSELRVIAGAGHVAAYLDTDIPSQAVEFLNGVLRPEAPAGAEGSP